MILDFKFERIDIIKRLRGWTIAEISERMKKEGCLTYNIDVDKWSKGQNKPKSFDRIELLAKATLVPVGFYYYNKVNIELKDLMVRIHIIETDEEVIFEFV